MKRDCLYRIFLLVFASCIIQNTIFSYPQIDFGKKNKTNNSRSKNRYIELPVIYNHQLGNSLFLLQEELWEMWDGSRWVKDSKYSYIYDDNDFRVEKLYQEWQHNCVNPYWLNNFMEIYFYDLNYNTIEEINMEWRESYWANNHRITWSYDGANNNIMEVWSNWNGTKWYQYRRSIKTFEHNVLTEQLWEDWKDSKWVKNRLVNLTYDENRNLIEELWQRWNGTGWDNSCKWTSTYDNENNLTEQLEQVWIDYNCLNSALYKCIYDEQENLIEDLWQLWNNSQWDNYIKRTYNYYENGNLYERIRKEWINADWSNISKMTCIYFDPTSIMQSASSPQEYILFQNYPNPFNPSTKIKYAIPTLVNSQWPAPTQSGAIVNNITLKVYDVLGREVSTLVNEPQDPGYYEVEFSVNGGYGSDGDGSSAGRQITSGIYFYRLHVGNHVETKKMILLK